MWVNPTVPSAVLADLFIVCFIVRSIGFLQPRTADCDTNAICLQQVENFWVGIHPVDQLSVIH